MIENSPERAKDIPGIDKSGDRKRTPRAIRFSEFEWNRIKTAATQRGISAGGFIRDAALAHASAQSGEQADVVSALTLPDGAMLTLFDGFRIVSLGDQPDVG